MTQDEIIEMARQAGIYHAFDSEGQWDGLTNEKLIERHPPHPNDLIYGDERIVEILEAFAKLVAAKATASEREACAKVIESHGETLANGAMLAESIRARGEQA